MRNRQPTLKALGLVFMAVCIVAAFATITLAAEFTADIVQKGTMGTMTGKIYVKGKNVRREMTIMGQKQITITRADKRVTWILMPQQMTYMEMKWNTKQAQASENLDELEKRGKKKYLGKEKISGYSCSKYVYTPNDPSQPPVTVWVSKKLNYPLKMKVAGPQGHMTILYKNIKQKKLSDSLFRVPKNYEKISMPVMPPMGNQ
ncbi:MAG: DUF4412 domain-containing protein [Deltaproteobacteria bacterium]|nr:DUF4412 domain-containing protein [Deltaproteobacteria bacterium]MBW1928216.1 DUF4412 domain-containing protein [Deltaproteobacteria bacterium]MBW2024337.1 DUF4412 domain-containing protein [Deltaproteobacteria bacterium]MBW2124634.1 DUF4412 domain-containing protein [Deltaproteobacteria bacterium]RLB21038.1 MAG: hypothetical protein DRG76_09850 [Deltaproteobacteria bacterium]